MNDLSLVSGTIGLLAASLYYGETICKNHLLETWIDKISKNYSHLIHQTGNAKKFLLILMKIEQKGGRLELESAFIEGLCSVSDIYMVVSISINSLFHCTEYNNK